MSVEPGPSISYGNQPGSAINTNQGPGANAGGVGLFDTRVGLDNQVAGWIGQGVNFFRALSVVPAAIIVGGIAPAAHVVSGTAMTLATAATGITVLASALTLPNGNVIPAGCLVLDGNPGVQNYGLANSGGNYRNKAWDNSKMLGRAISITAGASATGGHFLVSGYDTYGNAMSENINAASGVATTNGKKAFKFVASVVPQFTDAHNYSADTTDIFGLPIRAAIFDETMIWWNGALITANTGFVAADTTSPATTTTGDVRGTYAVQSASDGSKRLSIAVSPGQTTLGGNSVWGVTQA